MTLNVEFIPYISILNFEFVQKMPYSVFNSLISMQRLIFLALGILLVAAGCVSEEIDQAQRGQKVIRDAKTVMEKTNNTTCMQCGDSCIPISVSAYSNCAKPTKPLTCIFIDNSCRVAE